MSERKWHFRVEHILASTQRIQEYVEGMQFGDFCRDTKTQDAVVRNLEIIGEAARHVPRHAQAAAPELPWDLMRRMRNILAHDYERVSIKIVWDTIRIDIPPLTAALEAFIARLRIGE